MGDEATVTYAEYILVRASNVIKLTSKMSYVEAAAASLVYLTAWHSLITRGSLHANETVLIVGAGGGVNSACIQIAKLVGATVFVVGSSAEKLNYARTLGADQLIDRSAEEWSKAVFTRTDRRGVDVVVDNVGKETLFGSIRAVRRGGRILLVGSTGGAAVEVDLRYIFRKNISIVGSTMAPH